MAGADIRLSSCKQVATNVKTRYAQRQIYTNTVAADFHRHAGCSMRFQPWKMQCRCMDVHLEDIGIGTHERAVARNVHVTLVELPESASCHLGLVSAVHFADVEPLDAGDAMEGHVAGKRHRQIVSQAQQLAACRNEMNPSLCSSA